MRDIKNFKGDDTMNKIRNEEVVRAYTLVYDEIMSAFAELDIDEDPEHVQEVTEALDVLYKQLFEEGDR